MAAYLFRAGDFPASSWTDTSLVVRGVFEESEWIKLCQAKSSSRNMLRLAFLLPTGVRGSLGSSTDTEEAESERAFKSSPMELLSVEWA